MVIMQIKPKLVGRIECLGMFDSCSVLPDLAKCLETNLTYIYSLCAWLYKSANAVLHQLATQILAGNRIKQK